MRQLRQDLVATEVAGRTHRSAARALADTSDLYALLVAYSDLAGCHAMVAAVAAPPVVTRALGRPCASLERASALFTRAARRNDPGALVRATAQVVRAQPQLVRALVAVQGSSAP